MDRRHHIDRTQDYVRGQLEGEASGHDWWHVHRVWRTAVAIARAEDADLYVVQL
ncbi:MAG: phosphohydrolase, partial [Chloroflexia bacterium]|nr:phosphohydrolase [Chloroflexia bacterium]